METRILFPCFNKSSYHIRVIYMDFDTSASYHQSTEWQ